MNFVDKFLRFILSTAVTAVITATLASFFLPPGLSLREIPKVYTLMKQRNQNVDAWKLLETLQNENAMSGIMRELHMPQDANQSIATQATQVETFIDPAELERIDKMNLSNELKAELKRAYMQVGSIPKPGVAPVNPADQAAGVTASAIDRAPASVPAPITVKAKKMAENALRELSSELAAREQKPFN